MELPDIVASTYAIAPEITLIITGLLLIVIDPVTKKKNDLYWLALLGIFISFALNLSRFSESSTAFSGALSLDVFSAYFNVIFLLGCFLSILLSSDFLRNFDLNKNEFYSLLIFCTSGMMILTSAIELMSVFLGFEIMSISVYVLSGINKKSSMSSEAGIKYLVLGGLTSAIFLYGIALIYGATGTIYLNQIVNDVNIGNPLFLAGSAMILVGFIFKIGAFPLHQWVPDVYEGAPMTATAFMSVGVKAAAFAILLRIIFEGFSQILASIIPIIWVVSLFTMTVGNIAAISQNSIKRMLAYSSIAHAGYALIGIVAAFQIPELGVGSVIYYLFAYTFMNMGAFGVLAYLSKNGKECETFDEISGLWKRKPLVALALGIFMFSLAGIPPTIGFFAKYRVFLSAINADLYWLAIFGIINSVISAYYYLRVLVYAFMKEEIFGFPHKKITSSIALIILTIVTMIMGIFPFNSWDQALKAADSLLITMNFK